jgi:hypothetical protein
VTITLQKKILKGYLSGHYQNKVKKNPKGEKMKNPKTEKTLNRDELAGRHGEGAAPMTGESHGCSIHEFVEKNHKQLVRWCCTRWNGSGGDVMHTAVVIAIERKYGHMTTSLFRLLCQEAARNLEIYRWTQDEDGTIILPPTLRAGERLDAYFAVAPVDDPPQFSADCILAARKMKRAEEKGQLNFWTGGVEK